MDEKDLISIEGFLPRLHEGGWCSSETRGWLKNKIKDNYLRVPSMGACCPRRKVEVNLQQSTTMIKSAIETALGFKSGK